MDSRLWNFSSNAMLECKIFAFDFVQKTCILMHLIQWYCICWNSQRLPLICLRLAYFHTLMSDFFIITYWCLIHIINPHIFVSVVFFRQLWKMLNWPKKLNALSTNSIAAIFSPVYPLPCLLALPTRARILHLGLL